MESNSEEVNALLLKLRLRLLWMDIRSRFDFLTVPSQLSSAELDGLVSIAVRLRTMSYSSLTTSTVAMTRHVRCWWPAEAMRRGTQTSTSWSSSAELTPLSVGLRIDPSWVVE
jgi:hypothetical protein